MKRCKNQAPDRGGHYRLVSVLVLLFTVALFSQMRAQTSENYATLKGLVLEKETNLPVGFATVQ